MYIASNNAMRAPSGSFVSQWHKKHAQLHTFYTNARILIPIMTFYDAKPQSVKTPVAAKPSGISPNHPCQCSLVILSCYISPSHFSLQTTFNYACCRLGQYESIFILLQFLPLLTVSRCTYNSFEILLK